MLIKKMLIVESLLFIGAGAGAGEEKNRNTGQNTVQCSFVYEHIFIFLYKRKEHIHNVSLYIYEQIVVFLIAQYSTKRLKLIVIHRKHFHFQSKREDVCLLSGRIYRGRCYISKFCEKAG